MLVAPSQAPSRPNITYLLPQTKGNNSLFLGIMNFTFVSMSQVYCYDILILQNLRKAFRFPLIIYKIIDLNIHNFIVYYFLNMPL